MNIEYVLVFKHQNMTTQLPKPPKYRKKRKIWQKAVGSWCDVVSTGKKFYVVTVKMPHRKKKGKRKKVYRKNGKRYYRTKSGLVRLKGQKKPPRRR